MKNLLYIDDNDTNLCIFVEKFSHVFNVTTSDDPSAVLNLLQGQNFDAILLDIHMPVRNGFEVLNEINESCFSSIPVFMYTSDEFQAIRYQALASSASDILYRTLPDKEIELRILNKINIFSKYCEPKKHLAFGNLKLNLDTLEAFHQGINLKLTPIEFKILATLVQNYPEKITRETLAQRAWNSESVFNRTINAHTTNLRNKLPRDEIIIESPRGSGIILRKIKQNFIPTKATSPKIMIY